MGVAVDQGVDAFQRCGFLAHVLAPKSLVVLPGRVGRAVPGFQRWLGGVDGVGNAVPAGKLGGGFGQVCRAVGLSVLPVEERLFGDCLPLPGLGPVVGHRALFPGCIIRDSSAATRLPSRQIGNVLHSQRPAPAGGRPLRRQLSEDQEYVARRPVLAVVTHSLGLGIMATSILLIALRDAA